MSTDAEAPVVVDFPLRGEGWVAVNTPATRVPSHGTDMLGQRYAYDFVRTDDRPGVHVHPGSALWHAVVGVTAPTCYAWGAAVHAPFDGEVVAAVDGIGERTWIHPIREVVRMFWNALTFTPARLPQILGNHVIVRRDLQTAEDDAHPELFAGMVHLVPGSVTVTAGDRVRRGDVLGRVGHAGNSTSPHLHFQLMDAADALTAKGVPCAFREYEVEGQSEWVTVTAGIPSATERLRRNAPD